VAVYRLAWALTHRRSAAVLAAALLAGAPAFVMYSSGIGSDLPSSMLVTAALAVYVRHVAEPRLARFCLFALLAGASFLLRNPNVLLAGAVGVHQLILHRRRLLAQLPVWAAGAAVFGAFVAVQLACNLVMFGALVGGYAGEAQQGLSLAYVPHHLPRYLVILCAVPPLGLPALAVVVHRRRAEQNGIYLLCAGLVAAFVLFYSAWWALGFSYRFAFGGGARFLLPVVPLLCVFVAQAVLDVVGAAWARRALIAVGLAAQLAASAALTVELRRYKDRMAAHRDRIYAATARRALVLGPGEWSKLFFPRDGAMGERRYASYELATAAGELPRVVEAALRAGAPVYALGSGHRSTPEEARALAELHTRYRLVTTVDEQQPYELTVEEIVPR
jgi:hypothetical protein